MNDILINIAACMEIPVWGVIGCAIGAVPGMIIGAWIMADSDCILDTAVFAFLGMCVGIIMGGFVTCALYPSPYRRLADCIMVVFLLLLGVSAAVRKIRELRR